MEGGNASGEATVSIEKSFFAIADKQPVIASALMLAIVTKFGGQVTISRQEYEQCEGKDMNELLHVTLDGADAEFVTLTAVKPQQDVTG